MDLDSKVVVDAVEKVVDTVKDEAQKQLKEAEKLVVEEAQKQLKEVEKLVVDESKKVAELIEDASELVMKEASQLEVRVVEEIKKAQCCVPLAFLFDKFGRTPKTTLSKSEESESTKSK